MNTKGDASTLHPLSLFDRQNSNNRQSFDRLDRAGNDPRETARIIYTSLLVWNSPQFL